MFTTLLLRPEQAADFVGYAFDADARAPRRPDAVLARLFAGLAAEHGEQTSETIAAAREVCEVPRGTDDEAVGAELRFAAVHLNRAFAAEHVVRPHRRSRRDASGIGSFNWIIVARSLPLQESSVSRRGCSAHELLFEQIADRERQRLALRARPRGGGRRRRRRRGAVMIPRLRRGAERDVDVGDLPGPHDDFTLERGDARRR